MKRLFIVQLFYAIAEGIANGGGNVDPKPVELTSDKLTQLKAAYATQWQEMLKHSDPFAKETKDAKLALWKIEGEIKAEEAGLQKAANDAKAAELRNQRLQLNANQLDAYAKLIAIEADKKAKPEDVQALRDAFNTAKELVDNELLAKYASSGSSRKKAEGDNSSDADKDAKKAAILEMYAAGKTHKEIEEAGYARSTVWHTINNYKKANAEPA